jgi:hypothetical protein
MWNEQSKPIITSITSNSSRLLWWEYSESALPVTLKCAVLLAKFTMLCKWSQKRSNHFACLAEALYLLIITNLFPLTLSLWKPTLYPLLLWLCFRFHWYPQVSGRSWGILTFSVCLILLSIMFSNSIHILPFYGWVLSHCVNIPHFLFLRIHW